MNYNKPLLVDILNSKQKHQLQALMALWLFAITGFYVWWSWPTHIINPFSFSFNTLAISLPLLVPAYAFFFIRRMKKPNPELEVPKEWRVAYIVTKAPMEPWPVVKRTLTGMLADDSFPHDTWLADEDPTDETKLWCQENGVKISCRKGIAEYHNLDFPRRTKCKEGNLAYFYDTWGYRLYDFVSQHDADHMPHPGYLLTSLRGFVDPDVGYVSAPSICNVNAADSWIARGRCWAEGTLHGAMQAGGWGKWAPICIGSHFMVRTAALKDIGGLGPELSEDHSTTFLFCAGGWLGVHSIDSIATGRGPETFKDGLIQELQWSRSLFILLLTLTPKHLHRLTPRLQFQFVFSQLWYLIYTMTIWLMLLLSPIALILGQSFMNLSFWDFFITSTIPTALCILVVHWLKANNLLRPTDTKLWNWEAGLFCMARWPIILWAHVDAVKLTYFKNRRVWKVTPKRRDDDTIPPKLWAPFLVIALASAFIEVTFLPNSHTFYYSIFNFLNMVSYFGVVAFVFILNKAEATLKQQKQTQAAELANAGSLN